MMCGRSMLAISKLLEAEGAEFVAHLGPVYIIQFSYENSIEMLSYENGIV